jgi:hypothetical protein
MVNITFEEFDRIENLIEQKVNAEELIVTEYWPTKKEFLELKNIMSDNKYFLVLLNYIIENNITPSFTDLSKFTLKEYIKNNLIFV